MPATNAATNAANGSTVPMAGGDGRSAVALTRLQRLAGLRAPLSPTTGVPTTATWHLPTTVVSGLRQVESLVANCSPLTQERHVVGRFVRHCSDSEHPTERTPTWGKVSGWQLAIVILVVIMIIMMAYLVVPDWYNS